MQDGLARALATAGLAVALLSLGWQVFTWRRSTGRIKISLDKHTIDGFDGQYDVADVTVRNVGSGPVFVQSIAFFLTTAVPVVWEHDEKGPGLPASLESGQAEVWRF